MLGLAAALAAQAAPARQDLEALRSRIHALEQELEAKEVERREARDALRDSERAISEANRTLAALEAEERELRARSAQLAEQRTTLERALAERQRAVERMLATWQAAPAPDALRAALSGDDVGALGRRLHYIGYLSRAAADVLAAYRADLEALANLAREAAEKRERLRQVEEASRVDRARIVREREARRRVLERTAGELRRSRREIRVLQADEARLARLVAGLGRVLAKVEAMPEPSAEQQPFSHLRGKLRLPVPGELTGRFGAPRGAAGLESKGLFIRASGGAPVRAIAAGRVVYADWMRGFGNLLILDHGESYLSIYANNEALLKQVGESATTGEPLAITGTSGGGEETGLYFELRHLGRAFDPLPWVKLK